MAGRSKPNKAKELTGNPGKRAIHEPIRGEVGIPDKPAYLNEMESGYWEFYSHHLNVRGDLDKADGPALADMCVCCARLEEAEAIIRGAVMVVDGKEVRVGGLMVQGERGMVKNPAIQLSRNYRQQAQKYFEMFGVSPAPRGRMNIPEADDDNDGDFKPPSVKDFE